LIWFVNFAWELTNISRTSHNVQNLSCDMSFEHKNLASGRSVYKICACCGDAECTGAKGIRQHSSTAEWKTFSEKSGTQNWKIKTPVEVCCVLKTWKKENFSVVLPNMWCGPLLGRLLWAVSHEGQLLRKWQLYYCIYIVLRFIY
jgi:hypothetical protein